MYSQYAEINPVPSYASNINYDQNICDNHETSTLALRGIGMDNTNVSKLYFSGQNIKRIQKQIRQQIHIQSEGKFKLDVDQNEMDLLIAMRAVYIEHGKHQDSHVVRQVKKLNEQLLDYIMPDIMTNVNQYYGYIREINEPLKPILRPMNVSHAGRRALPSITTVWGF
jgi:hypothetical protein